MSSNSQIIRFPKGCTRRYVIVQVRQIETGVGCYDADREMVGFVRTQNQAQKDRVEELLVDCLDSSKKFKQPDWSFLDSEE